MQVIALATAAIAYLALCWLGLAYVSVPLTLLTVAAGLAVGSLLAAVGYLRVCFKAEDDRALTRPAVTRVLRPGARYPLWDEGWPGYLSGQLERDILFSVLWPGRQLASLWEESWNLCVRYPQWFLAVPLIPPPVGFLVGTTTGVYGGWLAFAVAAEMVAVFPRLARLAAIAALRSGDACVRWWYGAAATCPECRWVTGLPAYCCMADKCKSIHRDLRPGRLGVWWHRCQCGMHLPTTVLRASKSLDPVCPSCGHQLHKRAGSAPDARIALSGGPGVGKTSLLMRASAALTRGPDSSSGWKPADAESRLWLREARRLITLWPRTVPQPTAQPTLLTLHFNAEHHPRYLHLADIGGSHFTADTNDPMLWQLAMTRRHLLVLDATFLPVAREKMGRAALHRAGGREAPASDVGPEASRAMVELPYRMLVSQLTRFGGRTRQCSLAVVVAKADVLVALGIPPGTEQPGASSRWIRTWLCTMRLQNLVDAAEQDFQEVRYFLAGPSTELGDPMAPFAWLLARHPRGMTTP